MKHNRPTGGDGGRGGSVIIVAKQQVRTLLDVQMRKTFYASNGKHGGSNHKTGGEGSSFRVEIPVGTEVFNNDTGHLLKDMCVHNEELVVCIGGEGGKGNHRRSDAAQGDKGEVKTIRLELKLIADVGLIGIPNAGKSTLISRISNAKSKIAAFPFTTKEPVLGVVKSLYGDSFVIADIPGLIKGASEG
jgi:GTP-binding protein